MKDKICMVTGATLGIGKVTARSLAQKGANVIVVSRSAEKCAATVEALKQETGNPAVGFIDADLSSQKEIHGLAERFKERYQNLHVLVNNAGALFMDRQESVDGIEMTFALNHLGHFLLTDLLLDALRSSTPARIVNVGASAHRFARGVNFGDLQATVGYSGWGAYAHSKLCNLLFTYELARRLEGTGVTANALHPGVVATGFGHNNRGLMGTLVRLTNLASLSPERGAETIVYLAASPEVEGVTGKYFVNKKQVQSTPASYDKANAVRLWQASEAMVGRSSSP